MDLNPDVDSGSPLVDSQYSPASVALDPGTAAAINSAMNTLESSYTKAIAAWSGTAQGVNSLFGGEDPDYILGTLKNSFRPQIDKWRVRGQAFLAGNPAIMDSGQADTLTAWVDLGNTLISQMKSTAKDADESSIATIVEATAGATTQTIADKAKDVAKNVGGALVWWGKHGMTVMKVAGVAVAVVLLFVAWGWVAPLIGAGKKLLPKKAATP